MAGIDYETAKKLARRIIAAGNAEGVPFEQLVRNIMQQPGEGQGVAPEGAIATAMMPVPPRVITPASPAPMQPGIPLRAPRPTAAQMPEEAMGGPEERPTGRRQLLPDDVRQMAMAQMAPVTEEAPAPAPASIEEAPQRAPVPQRRAYSSPLRGALNAAEKELADMNAAAEAITATGQPLPPEAQVQIEVARRRVAQYRAEVQAEEGAELPQEIADVLARREKRLEGEGERIAKAEKDASADALIKAGLALMNPQRGANFLAALSAGAGQGLEAYDTAKAAAAERRARLGQSQDEIVLQRYDALTKAREAARAAAARGQKMDQDSLALMNSSNQVLFDKATMPERIETVKSEASIKATDAKFAPLKAQAELNAQYALAEARKAQANAARLGKTGSGDLKGAATIYSALLRSNDQMDDILSDPMVTDPKIKADARARKTENNRTLKVLEQRMGIGAPPPAKPAKPPKGGRIISSEPIAAAKK